MNSSYNKKRLLIALLFGFLTGILCVLLGMYGLKDTYSLSLALYVLANRTMIGFVIGISPFRMNWMIHGISMGFIASIPFALGVLLEPDKLGVFIASLLLGAMYGLIVEFFTTVVFKEKMR